MTDRKDLVEQLGELAADGFLLIETHNLYGIWDRIPTTNDPDWTDDSFREYLHQSFHESIYSQWQANLQTVFDNNQLDFLRFKYKTTTIDGRKQSKYPAAIFMRMMKELDILIHHPEKLEEYRAFVQRPSSWPEIIFVDGKVMCGDRKPYKPSHDEYVKLLAVLWSTRHIKSPDGALVQKGKKVSRSTVLKRTGIKSESRLQDIVTGIRKAMHERKIPLNVYSPSADEMFVEVWQS